MSEDLWQQAAGLALRLPGRGKRSVRVTRCESGEYVAAACVYTTTGEGVEECAAATGATADAALAALLPPVSGNEFNGWGESAPRRPRRWNSRSPCRHRRRPYRRRPSPPPLPRRKAKKAPKAKPLPPEVTTLASFSG